jgi:hypothetical protein
MKKTKLVVTRSAAGLAKAPGPTPADGPKLRCSELNSKFVKLVQCKR